MERRSQMFRPPGPGRDRDSTRPLVRSGLLGVWGPLSVIHQCPHPCTERSPVTPSQDPGNDLPEYSGLCHLQRIRWPSPVSN